MFKKNECKKCRKKINDKYEFCPYCGSSLNENFKNEDWGMLGKNDFFEEQKQSVNSSFGGGVLGKMLGTAMKMFEKELQKEIGNKVPIEQLDEILMDLGLEIDSIEEDDIKIEIGAERPDLITLQGLSKLLKCYINDCGIEKYKVQKSGKKVIIDKSVNEVRPYTFCAIVKNLKLDDTRLKEIIRVQEKIHDTYGRKRKKTEIGRASCRERV